MPVRSGWYPRRRSAGCGRRTACSASDDDRQPARRTRSVTLIMVVAASTCVHVAFGAQPHAIEVTARPHAHRDQRAVLLVARGDAHVLAPSVVRLGEKSVDHCARVVRVHIVEDGAVGAVGVDRAALCAGNCGFRVAHRQHGEILAHGERAVIARSRSVLCHRCGAAPAAHVVDRVMAQRAFEVHRPQRGAHGRRWRCARR